MVRAMTIDTKALRKGRIKRYWVFVKSYRNKLLQSIRFRNRHKDLTVKEFTALTLCKARKDVGKVLKKFRKDIHKKGQSNEYYFDVMTTRQKHKERWGVKEDDLGDLPEGADT